MAKKMNENQLRFFHVILGSLIATLALIFGVFAAYSGSLSNLVQCSIFSSIGFFLLAISNCHKIFFMKWKHANFTNFIIAILYLIVAVASAFLSLNGKVVYIIVGILFAITIMINRVLVLIKSHRPSEIILNGSLFLLAAGLFVYLCIPGDTQMMTLAPLLYGMLIALVAFTDIFRYCFVGFRKNVLIRILKRTYTFEILYGLLTLIVGISIIISVSEPKFEHFGDALWYCFAVVTTIGFGDYTCVTVIGRVLTIILGVYGLVVVALITSIVVNFYNELTPKKDIDAEETKEESKKD